MKMTEVVVSVIVPCYRMGAYIGKALESVGRQTYREWEVIVVDDCGPEDGTAAAAKAFAEAHPEHRVEFIRHEINQGVSAARNTAIAAAKGEWLAFLDPDDYWFEHHLSNAIGLIEKRPDTGVVACSVEAFFMDEKSMGISLWEISDWKISQFPASLMYHNFIQPSAALVKREHLISLKGFDTDPALQHVEDFDLWIRLAEHGVIFAFLREAGCRYRKHAGGATNNDVLMRMRHQQLIKKHTMFFIHMQSILLQNQLSQLRVNEQSLSMAVNGPIMRRFLKIDQLLSRWKRRLIDAVKGFKIYS